MAMQSRKSPYRGKVRERLAVLAYVKVHGVAPAAQRFGLDRKITSRCLNLAAQCKKLKIPITTFMIASDPYLQRFVNEFTETNNGKAFFASLDHLGAFIFRDFESGKRKTVY